MKQGQWKSEKDPATLEEGLQQEKHENIIKIKYNTNKCKQWIRYIKLLFLLELTFFFGWGCYINLRSYYSQATENEVTDIIRERYVQNVEALESVAEMQKLHSTTEIPYSISMLSNNMVKISDINNPLMRSSSEDLVHDKEIKKNLMPFDAKISSIEFTEDANRLTLNNQKDHTLDTSNEIESLGVDVTTTTNLKDSVDFKIKFRNGAQDANQRFFDLNKDAAQNNHGEESSRDKIDEQVNTSLDSDLIICPPYQSYESSDMFSEQSIENSSTSQYHTSPAPISKFLEQIINILNDGSTKNKDKRNSDDSNILMSASSNASVSGSDGHLFNTWLPIAIQNTQDHHSSEISANIKQEEEKHKLMENIASPFNFEFLPPKIQHSIESLTSNDKFQWFNAPPVFANDLPLGLKDILESSKTQNPLLEDTLKDTKIINAFIPEKDKFHNECQIQVEMNVFRIKCPEIMFDEQWNLASPPTHTTDSSNVINFKDIFDLNMNDYYDKDYYDKDESEHLKDDLFSNENSNKKVVSLQQSAPVIDRVITSVPSLKDVLDCFFKINSFDKTEIDKHDGIHSSDQEKIKEEISSSSTIPSFTFVSDLDTIDFNTERSQLQEVSDTQQPKQLKVTEKQDFLNLQNAETFLKINPHVNALEKELTSIFNDIFYEMLNFIKQYQSNSFSKDDYLDDPYICNTFPDLCSESYRKKRMADDLTEQYEPLSNALEEVDKNADVLKNLKKTFQKMEILAAYIDKLHKRLLLNNKLDDDYVSNEFSIETKEH